MPALQAIMRSEVALATKGNGPSAGEDMAHAARRFFNSLLFSLHLREITASRRGSPAARPHHSAAIRTPGAAARTSASTWLSNGTKFFWNMATRLRAVSSNSALLCQVLCG
jgi:hypothetical protein